MTNIDYRNWLNIKVKNTYFIDEKCPVFNLISLRETLRTMQNFNILIRKNSNQFSFYAGGDSNTSLVDIFQDLSSGTTLYFQLVLEDILFYNYTDIPNQVPGTLFHFTNQSTKSNLQLGNYVSETDTLKIKPKSFEIDITNITNVTIKYEGNDIASWNSNVLNTSIDEEERERVKRENPILFNIGNPSEINKLSISINWERSGTYELWLDNVKDFTFFYSKDVLAQNCFGIVQLNINEIINQTANIDYSIDFDARSVYWQYKIVNPDEKEIGININKVTMMQKNPNSSPPLIEKAFQGPLEEDFSEGQTVQIFTSSDPLKFQQKLLTNPKLIFSYPNTAGHKQEMEIKLPNPSPENLKKYINEQNEETLCSSTIVYV